MKKVKTFTMGLANGYSDAFARLDELVAGLGEVTIIDVVDTFYPAMYDIDSAPAFGQTIARRVIYQEAPKNNLND